MESVSRRSEDLRRLLLRAKLPPGSSLPATYIEREECRLDGIGWTAVVRLIEGETMAKIAEEVGFVSSNSVRNHLIKINGVDTHCKAIPPLILLFIKTYLGPEYAAIVGKEAYELLARWMRFRFRKGVFDPRKLLTRWVDTFTQIYSVAEFAQKVDPTIDPEDAERAVGSYPKAALGLTGKPKYMVWVLCRLAAEYERGKNDWPPGYRYLFVEGKDPEAPVVPSPNRPKDVMRLREAVLGEQGEEPVEEITWDADDDLWAAVVGMLDNRPIAHVASERSLRLKYLITKVSRAVQDGRHEDAADLLVWFMRTQLGPDYAEVVSWQTHMGLREFLRPIGQKEETRRFLRMWIDSVHNVPSPEELSLQVGFVASRGGNLVRYMRQILGLSGNRGPLLLAVCRLAAEYERARTNVWPDDQRIFTKGTK